MDVDHFKRVNDGHGHLAGDQVLRGVAGRIRSVVGDGGLVSRYGGEEFGIIVPDSSEASLAQLAEEIRGCIGEKAIVHGDCTVVVTASLGAVWIAGPEDAWTCNDVVAEADRLLYLAKRAGRDRVVCGQLAAAAGA